MFARGRGDLTASGQHLPALRPTKVVSLWEVERDRRHSPRLEKMLVVDHTEIRFREVIAYAAQVLDAVGLHYGPSHLELIVTADRPTIVELNSRLHGSLDPRLPRFKGFCGHILLVSPKAGC